MRHPITRKLFFIGIVIAYSRYKTDRLRPTKNHMLGPQRLLGEEYFSPAAGNRIACHVELPPLREIPSDVWQSCKAPIWSSSARPARYSAMAFVRASAASSLYIVGSA